MILAQRDGYWVLCQRCRADIPGVSIEVGTHMPALEAWNLNPGSGGRVRHAYVARDDDITFFPELRWRGLRCSPEYWKPESAEPILRIWISVHSFDSERLFGERLYDPAAYRRRLDEMQIEGDQRDGYNLWGHVDDLEKIVGPPPTGVF